MRSNQQLIPLTVDDVEEPYEERHLVVEVESAGVAINIDGYGLLTTEPKFGAVVLVEFRGGVPHVVVWSDITDEEPTHVISLAGASEKCRIPDEETKR